MKSAAPRATTDKAATPATSKGAAMVDNRAVAVAQRQMQEAIDTSPRQVAQRQQAEASAPRKNTTGLPDNLKAGVENLSGYSLDDVKVHYNSAQPAQLQAHAYAQGTDIHVAPGQEQHLPHEAWHVVQQKQGRVKATRQMKGGVNVNDDDGLEKEADFMGAKALSNTNAQLKAVQENGLREYTDKHAIFQLVVKAAEGFKGADDEEFLIQMKRFIIVPTTLLMQDEGEGIIYMIIFDGYQCQVHIHELPDGKITAAHIKSNETGLRHRMDFTDARIYLNTIRERGINTINECTSPFTKWKRSKFYGDDMDEVVREEYEEYLAFLRRGENGGDYAEYSEDE